MKRVAIDTETTGLSTYIGCRPFAVGMCFEDGEEKFWEWPVDPMTRMPIVNDKDRKEIQKICSDPNLMKEFWNMKFDINMLKSIGIDVAWPCGEGTFMAKACDATRPTFALKPLSKSLIDYPDDDQKDLQKAVVKCRRVAKKLGWKIAQGKDAVVQDYWLPFTLAHFHPRLARKHDLYKFKDANKKYCVSDCERTIFLCTYFRHGMKDLKTEPIYNFEMDLMKEVTLGMENRGVIVDSKRMAKVRKICQDAKDEALEVLIKASGDPDFNPGSTKQIIELLFCGKGPGGIELPVLKRTKGGAPKADAEAIAMHQNDPLVASLLKYRANSKALSTFFDAFDKWSIKTRYGQTLHTTWNQWGTLTGRYTSRDPSLQCIPNPKTTNSKAAEYVIDVRQIFKPRKGHVWYCPDYSQVEVIIFADIAQEQSMLKAIRNGEDIHSATTNKIWGGEDNPKALPAMKKVVIASEKQKDREGKDFEDYDINSSELEDIAIDALIEHDFDISKAESAFGIKIYRKLAKAATFVKIFGGGANALMGWIGSTHAEADRYLKDYDNSFPDMVRNMKEIEMRGKMDGFIINPFGRYLKVDRWYAYRAINYVVQSAAADLMKRGMLKCARMLKKECPNLARIIMTIHDELIFEMKEGTDTRRRLKKICGLMSDHEGVFSVPTPADMDKVTERWSIKEAV